MSKYTIQEADYNTINPDIKIVIISAEFNRESTKALEEANIAFLEKKGFKNIAHFLVPGALEIPAFTQKVIDKISPDIIIVFGVVIRGDTTHYEIVSENSSLGLMNISIKPDQANVIINGILTCENQTQVEQRISDTYARSALNTYAEYLKLDSNSLFGLSKYWEDTKKVLR